MTAPAEFLRSHWAARAPRERVLLGVLAAALAGALWFFLLVDPLARRAENFEDMLAAEQVLLQRVDALRARVVTLPATRTRSDTSLLLAANRALQAAGLSEYLEESNADGERRVRLRLKDAPFPQVSAWLTEMATREGAHTINAVIAPTGTPGLTQVNLVLERPN
ncbi:type II secretion system protein GspM [Candidatus Foliamicus sp.]